MVFFWYLFIPPCVCVLLYGVYSCRWTWGSLCVTHTHKDHNLIFCPSLNFISSLCCFSVSMSPTHPFSLSFPTPLLPHLLAGRRSGCTAHHALRQSAPPVCVHAIRVCGVACTSSLEADAVHACDLLCREDQERRSPGDHFCLW